MKTILSIIAVTTVFGLYSTGMFVPDSQGLVDTVAGLTALSDANMAQNIGGPSLNQFRLEYQSTSGSVAVCTTNIFLECPPNPQVWHASLANCEDCKSGDRAKDAYQNMLIVGKIDSGCNWSYGDCETWQDPTTLTSCDCYMHPHCH